MEIHLSDITLKTHQQKVIDIISKPSQHGLLVYHGLGSGKTITSILAAKYNKMNAAVIVPASLQENYKKEIRKVKAKKSDYHITSYSKFSKEPKHIKNTEMLILDEAHKIKNSATKRAKAVASVSKDYKKVLLLTGTPIQNKPYEVATLINMAAGKKKLPISEVEFNKEYINKVKVTPNILDVIFKGAKPYVKIQPKNLGEFREKTKGLVSYYGVDANNPNYPKVERYTDKVMMDKDQEKLYKYYKKQLPSSLKYIVSHNIPVNKRDASALNSFMSATRQISNVPGKFYKGEPKVSPKIHVIAKKIYKSKLPSLVYSNFLDNGVFPLAKELTRKKVKFGIYTGQLSSKQKNDLVKRYNSKKIKALLVSSAGGEGLDLKDTGTVHIMEPHWNESKINQVIGRAVRFKSHNDLPPSKRVVKVYKYLSDIPNENTADEYLYNMGRKKTKLNNKFLSILKQNGTSNE